MVTRWRLPVLLLGMTACAAGMSGRRWAEPGSRPDVRTLANGLRQVTQAGEEGVTSLRLTVHTGSTADPPGKGGLAHLVERLVTNSSSPLDSGWLREVEGMGGVWAGARTDLDETSYYATVPAWQAARLVDASVRLAQQPLRGIDEAAFRREQRIVESEGLLQDDLGMPREAWGLLSRSLFEPAHAYARPEPAANGVAGDGAEGIEFSEAMAFISDNYRPDNMTLAVVGNIDDSTRRQLERFASLSNPSPRGASAQATPAWNPQLPGGPRLRTIHVVDDEPHLWVAWKLPPSPQGINHEAFATGEVVLGRLRYPLGDESNSAVEVATAGVYPGKQSSILVASLRLTKDADPSATLDWVAKQVRRALILPRTAWIGGAYREAEPLAATSGLVSTAWLVWAEQPSARAQLLTDVAHGGRSPAALFEHLVHPSTMSADALRSWAEQWVTADRLRAVCTLPGGSPAEASDVVTKIEPPVAVSKLVVNRSPDAWMNAVRPPPTSKLETGTLLNGLTYALLDWPGSRVSTVILGHNRGVADASRPEVGRATQLSLMRDTWLEVGERGLLFSRLWGADSSAIFVQSPFEDVKTVAEFALQRERTEGPHWPEYILNWREEAQTWLPQYNKAWERLLRDHPWGTSRAALGLREVDASEIDEHYARSFDASHGLLVAVGDLSDPDVKSAIKDAGMRLALPIALSARPPEKPVAAPVMWTPQSSVEFEPMQRNAPMAEYRCLLPAGTPAAVRRMLGAASRTALENQLRAQRGSSSLAQWDVTGFRGDFWVLTLDADVPRSGAKQALRVWRDFRSRPSAEVLGGELPGARLDALRSVTEIGLTQSATAHALFAAWVAGEPMASVGQLPQRIVNTTDAEMLTAFDFCREHSVLTFYGEHVELSTHWDELSSEAEQGAAVSERSEPAQAPLDAGAGSD